MFFVLFVWAAHTHNIGLVVVSFTLAWSLDAVDGYVARKFNQATRFGYIFDKAVDRIVLFCGLLILLMNKLVPDYSLLILVKDISALPAASLQIHSTKAMPSMGRIGKVSAVAQGIAIGWVLLDAPLAFFVVLVVAVLGGAAGGYYLYRVYYK